MVREALNPFGHGASVKMPVGRSAPWLYSVFIICFFPSLMLCEVHRMPGTVHRHATRVVTLAGVWRFSRAGHAVYSVFVAGRGVVWDPELPLLAP